MSRKQLQQDLIDAAKKGEVNTMMKLIEQGADALAYDSEDTPIISYLSQSSVDKEKMREFIKFLAPYIYKKK